MSKSTERQLKLSKLSNGLFLIDLVSFVTVDSTSMSRGSGVHPRFGAHSLRFEAREYSGEELQPL